MQQTQREWNPRPSNQFDEANGPIAKQVDSFAPALSAFGLPIYVAPLPAGSIQRVCYDTLPWLISLTHDLPDSFALSGYPVYLADSQFARFSLDANSLDTPMTTIDKDNKLVTLINIFTVEPAKQQQLVDLLIHATETSMRHLPGFISANIHRSLDGTKVANYAQWRSVEDFQAMQKNPAAKPHMEQAAALAKFEPGLYEVVDTQFAAPNV